MKKEANVKTPILYKPHLFFLAVSFMPIAIMSLTLGMHFYWHSGHSGIPMISAAAVDLPESRTFSVGMNIVAWFSMPLFLLIDRILKLKCRIEQSDQRLVVVRARWLMNVAAGFSFFSLLGLASVTIREQRTFHLVSATVFIASLSLFFVLADFVMKAAKLKVTAVHWVWDLMCPMSFGASYLMWRSGTCLSCAALMQYVGGAALFLKFLCLWWTLPEMGVLLTKKAA